jgi:hypothetical protein
MSQVQIENAQPAKIVLMDVEAIKKDQDAIKRNLTKLDMQIHLNAVQCILHASIHRDTSLMRRLLVNIIDDKSGYRKQGLINWMRKHTPMELKLDTINLSGKLTEAGRIALIKQYPDIDQSKLIVGEERPFLIEEANNTVFWSDKDNAERVVKPVYRDTLFSKVDSALKEFRASLANTHEGKPIDPTKPFYDGIHTDKVVDFFNEVERLKAGLPKDSTREVRQAQAQLKEAIENAGPDARHLVG